MAFKGQPEDRSNSNEAKEAKKWLEDNVPVEQTKADKDSSKKKKT